jgi:8-oxo-dGTP pyrophosphatase MutT (NUDIX family)
MGSFAQPRVDVRQVAAVCYRRTGKSIEFLLVRTGRGRWSFPKGHTERTLTVREAAAREALEEAGAVGVIARRHFASYRHKKRTYASDVTVRAYLLEVRRTIDPPESHREPRWFRPHEARVRLAAARKAKYGKDLHVVLDRALRLLTEERHPDLLP